MHLETSFRPRPVLPNFCIPSPRNEWMKVSCKEPYTSQCHLSPNHWCLRFANERNYRKDNLPWRVRPRCHQCRCIASRQDIPGCMSKCHLGVEISCEDRFEPCKRFFPALQTNSERCPGGEWTSYAT